MAHLIYFVGVIFAAGGFVLLTRYKGTNTDTKIDNLSNRMDGFQLTLQAIQIENAKTSERVLNIQDQLKDIKYQHDKNN